jgi:hypothetical protein
LKKFWLSSAKLAPACGAPDSVRCPGWPSDELVALGKKRRRCDYNSPDCPVSQRRPRPTVGSAISGRRMARSNGQLVHRTVSSAPTGPKVPRSAASDEERDWAPDGYYSCSVGHQTVWCATRQKARIAFQFDLQRLLAALGL